MDKLGFVGMELPNGWVIEKERNRLPDASGGAHSLSYVARHRTGGHAFVKILDTTIDQEAVDPLADLKLRIDVFQYERVLAQKCTGMSRVVRAIDAGSIASGHSPNPIYFLIFEMAECDLREQADLSRRFDVAFRMRVLHHTAVGLQQLHSAQIAHQDLKPSNVLVFKRDEAKLGDLGHAHDRTSPRPGKDRVLAADETYAPPEQLYGYRLDEWDARRLSTDLYLLGSIAVFLFTGVGMTPQLRGQLRPEHHWDVWTDSYQDVLPFVREAWNAVIYEFAKTIDGSEENELVTLVRYLSEPDPLRRGHPHNLAGNDSTYGLQRFISRFDFLASRAEWELRRKLRNKPS